MPAITNLRSYLTNSVSIIAFTALLAFAALAARSWLEAHDASIHLAATLEAQRQILADAEHRQRQRDDSLAVTLNGIAQAKRRVNTPARAAAEIPQILPPLPEPVRIEVPSPTPQQPQPPAEAVIPQADLKPIYDALQDCRACQASLAATRDNLADEHAKLTALAAERDAALRASRGGSVWSRLRRNTKWFVLGAATGALAAAASH